MSSNTENARQGKGKDAIVLAQWCYGPEERRGFAKHELLRAKRERRNELTFFLAGGSLLTAIMLLVAFVSRSSMIGCGLIVPALIAIVASLTWIWDSSEARELYQARIKGPHEVLITPRAIYDAGVKIPLTAWNRRLLRVYIHSKDSSTLRFSLLVGRYRREVHILIPQDRDEEAHELVDKFQSRIWWNRP